MRFPDRVLPFTDVTVARAYKGKYLFLIQGNVSWVSRDVSMT